MIGIVKWFGNKKAKAENRFWEYGFIESLDSGDEYNVSVKQLRNTHSLYENSLVIFAPCEINNRKSANDVYDIDKYIEENQKANEVLRELQALKLDGFKKSDSNSRTLSLKKSRSRSSGRIHSKPISPPPISSIPYERFICTLKKTDIAPELQIEFIKDYIFDLDKFKRRNISFLKPLMGKKLDCVSMAYLLTTEYYKNYKDKYWIKDYVCDLIKNYPREALNELYEYFSQNKTKPVTEYITSFSEDFLIFMPQYLRFGSPEQVRCLFDNAPERFYGYLEKYALYGENRENIMNILPQASLAKAPQCLQYGNADQIKYLFDSAPEIFDEYLQKCNPYSISQVAKHLPNDFLVRSPQYLQHGSADQIKHLFDSAPEIFDEYLQKCDPNAISKVVKHLPNDFLVRSPQYLQHGSADQIKYLFDSAPEIFDEYLQKCDPYFISPAVEYLPNNLLVNYPQYKDFASAKQLKHIERIAERQKIWECAKEKGVKHLVHFTQIENLKGILNYGLVTRTNLERQNIDYLPTDQDRLDRVCNSISLSVEFPNYKMFFTKRCCNKEREESFPNKGWCVISISAESVLKNIDCSFNPDNAAKSENSGRHNAENRQTVEWFKKMFDDNAVLPIRDKLVNPNPNEKGNTDKYATDPQAEILCLGDIPIDFIKYCSFSDKEDLEKYKEDLDKLNIKAILYDEDALNNKPELKYRTPFSKGPYLNYPSSCNSL